MQLLMTTEEVPDKAKQAQIITTTPPPWSTIDKVFLSGCVVILFWLLSDFETAVASQYYVLTIKEYNQSIYLSQSPV